MSTLALGLLSALLATNPPAAVSNLVNQRTGLRLEIPDPHDPVEQRYHQLLEEDDEAQAEIDRWIQDQRKLDPKEAELAQLTLRSRIRQRMATVRQHYQDFVELHPRHVRARIAFGGFLTDLGEEDEARQQWEKALEVAPNNPAIWNNLGNYFGHAGQVGKTFEYYGKALELDPNQPLYHQNLATTMYLFRKPAQDYYRITERELYARVLQHYRKALTLDPTNFPLATDLAQTYYGFKPPLTGDAVRDREALRAHYEEALAAWQGTLKLARDEIEREGVYVHLARVLIELARTAEARRQLDLITNGMYFNVKGSLLKKAEAQERGPAVSPAQPPAP